MEFHERELVVARIASGSVRCRVGGERAYLVKHPTRDQVYIAQEMFAEVARDSHLEGAYTEEELYDFLIDNGLWDAERDKQLAGIVKDIEEFKFKLWKLTFKSNERAIARKALGVAKALLEELMYQRHAYDHLSCLGAAQLARSRYLLGSSLCDYRGKPVFDDDTFWEQPSRLLDEITEAYGQVRLPDSTIREVARTEPWRTIWVCRKSEGLVFGLSPVDYTEEQRSLIGWSNLFDNVYEHPDCPSEDVICDDDILDGWLIDQRKQREDRLGKKAADDVIGNEKIRNSGEVFVVAESKEDIKRVFELNDEHAKHVLRQRFAYLNKKGTVNEADMPDTANKITMQRVRMMSESFKGQG